MHQEDYFGYYKKETFTILKIPYIAYHIAMVFLLPSSMDGIEEVEKQLGPGLFNKIKGRTRQTKAQIYHFQNSDLNMKIP